MLVMSHEDGVEQEGVVVEALPNALYRVELESKERIVAHASHQPRRNFVRILIGDRVLVTVSPRNRLRGRITERRPERRLRGHQ
jgi:translation initiation factor IF-1